MGQLLITAGKTHWDDMESDDASGPSMERAKNVLKSLFNALSGLLLGRVRERRRPTGLRGWDALHTDRNIPITSLVVRAIHEQRRSWARQNRWSVRESTVGGFFGEGSGEADERCLQRID